jgi:CHAD domain-containing protein
VEDAFGRTRTLLERIEPEHTDTVHRTRIAFKRFRYMVEALAEQLPSPDRRLLAAMRRYQGRMGVVQDAAVLLEVFDKFVRRRELAPEAVNRLRRKLVGLRERRLRVCLASLHQLSDFL